MRRGEYIRILAEENIYAFARKLGKDKNLIALNLSDQEIVSHVPGGELWEEDQHVKNLLNHEGLGVEDGQVELKLLPWGGVLLG